MLTPATALHTAARRYLMGVHALWIERYSHFVGSPSGGYSPEQRDIFPRYNVAAAMLEAVERFSPDTVGSFEETRERLVEIAHHATNLFTESPVSEIEAHAMAQERRAFEQYIRSLSATELAKIEPLPYRRVLTSNEVSQAWQALSAAWGVSGYWYPLTAAARQDVLAVQAPYFDRDVGADGLRGALRALGTDHVLELREYGPNYRIDLCWFEPTYTGAEGFWCSAEVPLQEKWLVYASHESSVTLGGAPLIQKVKDLWPEWERYIWTTPFF
jgi:hypothetical protein